MMIQKVFLKYKPIIFYLIFGVTTTIINIATYTFLYHSIGLTNVVSNIIAWVAAVIVAFVTNKIWVFESKTVLFRHLMQEFITFIVCRLATGAIDLIIMYIAVDVMKWNAVFMKVISNIIVIVLNFVASKVFIFKDRKAIE